MRQVIHDDAPKGAPEEAPEEHLLTTEEVAIRIRMSTSYVNKIRKAGLIGFIDMSRNGKRVIPRYTDAHVDAYLDQRDHPARLSA